MDTLKTIQKVFRVAKIICQILFICCIVGCCLCLVAAVSLGMELPTLTIGRVNIISIVEAREGISNTGMVMICLAGAVQVAGLGILAKLAQRYLAREQKDGTPFTLGGAKQLRRLGIYSIWVPIAAQAIALAVCKTLSTPTPLPLDSSVPVSYGLMLVFLSLVCQYGAELQSGKA